MAKKKKKVGGSPRRKGTAKAFGKTKKAKKAKKAEADVDEEDVLEAQAAEAGDAAVATDEAKADSADADSKLVPGADDAPWPNVLIDFVLVRQRYEADADTRTSGEPKLITQLQHPEGVSMIAPKDPTLVKATLQKAMNTRFGTLETASTAKTIESREDWEEVIKTFFKEEGEHELAAARRVLTSVRNGLRAHNASAAATSTDQLWQVADRKHLIKEIVRSGCLSMVPGVLKMPAFPGAHLPAAAVLAALAGRKEYVHVFETHQVVSVMLQCCAGYVRAKHARSESTEALGDVGGGVASAGAGAAAGATAAGAAAGDAGKLPAVAGAAPPAAGAAAAAKGATPPGALAGNVVARSMGGGASAVDERVQSPGALALEHGAGAVPPRLQGAMGICLARLATLKDGLDYLLRSPETLDLVAMLAKSEDASARRGAVDTLAGMVAHRPMDVAKQLGRRFGSLTFLDATLDDVSKNGSKLTQGPEGDAMLGELLSYASITSQLTTIVPGLKILQLNSSQARVAHVWQLAADISTRLHDLSVKAAMKEVDEAAQAKHAAAMTAVAAAGNDTAAAKAAVGVGLMHTGTGAGAAGSNNKTDDAVRELAAAEWRKVSLDKLEVCLRFAACALWGCQLSEFPGSAVMPENVRKPMLKSVISTLDEGDTQTAFCGMGALAHFCEAVVCADDTLLQSRVSASLLSAFAVDVMLRRVRDEPVPRLRELGVSAVAWLACIGGRDMKKKIWVENGAQYLLGMVHQASSETAKNNPAKAVLLLRRAAAGLMWLCSMYGRRKPVEVVDNVVKLVHRRDPELLAYSALAIWCLAREAHNRSEIGERNAVETLTRWARLVLIAIVEQDVEARREAAEEARARAEGRNPGDLEPVAEEPAKPKGMAGFAAQAAALVAGVGEDSEEEAGGDSKSGTAEVSRATTAPGAAGARGAGGDGAAAAATDGAAAGGAAAGASEAAGKAGAEAEGVPAAGAAGSGGHGADRSRAASVSSSTAGADAEDDELDKSFPPLDDRGLRDAFRRWAVDRRDKRHKAVAAFRRSRGRRLGARFADPAPVGDGGIAGVAAKVHRRVSTSMAHLDREVMYDRPLDWLIQCSLSAVWLLLYDPSNQERFLEAGGLDLCLAVLDNVHLLHDSVVYLTLNTLWTCAQRTAARPIVSDADLEIPEHAHDISMNEDVLPKVRLVAAGLLVDMMHDTDVASRMKATRGDFFLEEMFVDFAAQPDFESSNYGASMMARTCRSADSKNALAGMGAPQVLVRLLKLQGNGSAVVVLSALHALLNLSTESAVQAIVGRVGLKQVMHRARDPLNPDMQAFASRIVLNLRHNPANRTRLYRLELEMRSAEWRKAALLHVDPDAPSKAAGIVPGNSEHARRVNTLPSPKRGDKSKEFLAWLGGVEAQKLVPASEITVRVERGVKDLMKGKVNSRAATAAAGGATAGSSRRLLHTAQSSKKKSRGGKRGHGRRGDDDDDRPASPTARLLRKKTMDLSTDKAVLGDSSDSDGGSGSASGASSRPSSWSGSSSSMSTSDEDLTLMEALGQQFGNEEHTGVSSSGSSSGSGSGSSGSSSGDSSQSDGEARRSKSQRRLPDLRRAGGSSASNHVAVTDAATGEEGLVHGHGGHGSGASQSRTHLPGITPMKVPQTGDSHHHHRKGHHKGHHHHHHHHHGNHNHNGHHPHGRKKHVRKHKHRHKGKLFASAAIVGEGQRRRKWRRDIANGNRPDSDEGPAARRSELRSTVLDNIGKYNAVKAADWKYLEEFGQSITKVHDTRKYVKGGIDYEFRPTSLVHQSDGKPGPMYARKAEATVLQTSMCRGLSDLWSGEPVAKPGATEEVRSITREQSLKMRGKSAGRDQLRTAGTFSGAAAVPEGMYAVSKWAKSDGTRGGRTRHARRRRRGAHRVHPLASPVGDSAGDSSDAGRDGRQRSPSREKDEALDEARREVTVVPKGRRIKMADPLHGDPSTKRVAAVVGTDGNVRPVLSDGLPGFLSPVRRVDPSGAVTHVSDAAKTLVSTEVHKEGAGKLVVNALIGKGLLRAARRAKQELARTEQEAAMMRAQATEVPARSRRSSASSPVHRRKSSFGTEPAVISGGASPSHGRRQSVNLMDFNLRDRRRSSVLKSDMDAAKQTTQLMRQEAIKAQQAVEEARREAGVVDKAVLVEDRGTGEGIVTMVATKAFRWAPPIAQYAGDGGHEAKCTRPTTVQLAPSSDRHRVRFGADAVSMTKAEARKEAEAAEKAMMKALRAERRRERRERKAAEAARREAADREKAARRKKKLRMMMMMASKKNLLSAMNLIAVAAAGKGSPKPEGEGGDGGEEPTEGSKAAKRKARKAKKAARRQKLQEKAKRREERRQKRQAAGMAEAKGAEGGDSTPSGSSTSQSDWDDTSSNSDTSDDDVLLATGLRIGAKLPGGRNATNGAAGKDAAASKHGSPPRSPAARATSPHAASRGAMQSPLRALEEAMHADVDNGMGGTGGDGGDESPDSEEEMLRLERVKKAMKQAGLTPAQRSVQMSRFRHIDGAQVCKGIYGHFTMPDGTQYHYYHKDTLHELTVETSTRAPPAPKTLADIWMTHLPNPPAPEPPAASDAPEPHHHTKPAPMRHPGGADGSGSVLGPPVRLLIKATERLERATLTRATGDGGDAANKWTVYYSVFRPRVKTGAGRSFFDEGRVQTEMFVLDWRRICEKKRMLALMAQGAPESNWVQVAAEVGEVVEEHYELLCNLYDLYSLYGEVDFAVSKERMEQCIDDMRARERDTPGAASVSFFKLWRESNLERKNAADSTTNLDNALMRFEFVELLLRLAIQKYNDSGELGDVGDAFITLMRKDAVPNLDVRAMEAADKFRRNRVYVEGVDNVLRKYSRLLRAVHTRYCAYHRQLPPGQWRLELKPFMRFLKDASLLNNLIGLTKDDATYLFVKSKMRVVDDMHNRLAFTSLDYCDFLEVLCRIADATCMPTADDLKKAGVSNAFAYFKKVTKRGSAITHTRRKSAAWEAPKTRPLAEKLERLLEYVMGWLGRGDGNPPELAHLARPDGRK